MAPRKRDQEEEAPQAGQHDTRTQDLRQNVRKLLGRLNKLSNKEITGHTILQLVGVAEDVFRELERDRITREVNSRTAIQIQGCRANRREAQIFKRGC